MMAGLAWAAAFGYIVGHIECACCGGQPGDGEPCRYGLASDYQGKAAAG